MPMPEYPETLLVKLPAGTKERMRERHQNVSAWVRGLIEAGLSDVVQEVSASKPALAENDAALLAAMGPGRWTAREACRALGWTELRLDRAVKRLGDRIVFHGGGVMSVAEDGSDG